MAIDGGIIYDGELTVWDLGSRTTTGFFTTNEAVALNWGIQVTVVTKHAGASTIDSDQTVMYYVQNQPNRFIRVHLLTLTSTSTATVSVKLGAM